MEDIPAPMLAKAVTQLPQEDGWQFEPKWDGFRAIADRRDGLVVHSRSGKSLDRYFPELVTALLEEIPAGSVLDGEIIIPTDVGCDFDLLTQRIHPAASRVTMLSTTTPAVFVAFDLLMDDQTDLRDAPLSDRIEALDSIEQHEGGRVLRSPSTRSVETAQDWFHSFEGAGLDGIVAKGLDGAYVGGARHWLKLKHQRTADCVVAGYRIHKDGIGVGALLLGLYDEEQRLQFVGSIGALPAKVRRTLIDELAPLVIPEVEASESAGAVEEHPWLGAAAASGQVRVPGELNRWNASKMRDWIPLRPERVVEVGYSQLQANRFRHNATLVRWRDDRTPTSCSFDQIEVATPIEFRTMLSAAAR